MQLRKRIRHLFQPKALVLMYHRIASVKTDPWQLAVSPENFEEHLKILKKTAALISVKNMVSSLRDKAVKKNTVCLTFDDGYIDNYLEATPLLEEYESPATFFIPTYYTSRPQEFWWDELETIMLRYPELPATFTLPVKGVLFEFDLKDDRILTEERLKKHEHWAWPATPPTRRCELYLSVWEKIRPLPFDELQTSMDIIKSWATYKKPIATDNFPMRDAELNILANHPFIDLGLHTNTHPALSFHNNHTQQLEISDNKKILEGICGRPVETIAYPYGSYNETTIAVVKELKMNAGFTTTEKIVSNLTDPFQIGRFQVRNLNGNDFENWLMNLKKSPQFL